MVDPLHVDSQSLERYEKDGENSIAIRSLDDIKRVSLIFVKSGMFKGDKNLDAETKMYQAGVKIIAGVEFGIQPFAAMRGINIINGNAEMSANLMAAKVKKHPKYDYRVKHWDNHGCELAFYEYMPDGTKEELGPSSFTMDDAKQAGLTSNPTWHKFPKNMCFARALSNGVRIHCPDVFYGAPVYTEGEISGEFDSEPEPAPAALPEKAGPVEAEVVLDTSETQEPEPEQETVTEPAQPATSVKWITDKQRKDIVVLATQLGAKDKAARLELVSNELERQVESTNELTGEEAEKVIAALTDAKKVAA